MKVEVVSGETFRHLAEQKGGWIEDGRITSHDLRIDDCHAAGICGVESDCWFVTNKRRLAIKSIGRLMPQLPQKQITAFREATHLDVNLSAEKRSTSPI
ncbi:MAG: hypothetical protein P8Z30_04370 [Acidobacteriota bacterium]